MRAKSVSRIALLVPQLHGLAYSRNILRNLHEYQCASIPENES